MDTERWTRVEQLCQEALERDLQQQTAFLDSACGTNQELRREVESLLAHRQRAGTFLEAPAVQMAAKAFAEESNSATGEASRLVGRLISHYRVIEKVASGGMGDVYRARRADGSYDKQVAIKIIQGPRSTDFFLVRFQNERQILANLDHPNIAQLVDGGTTEEGLPYLIMEFVEGQRIDEFSAHKDLGVRERLELFRTVCSAVHYAHQNLVVHRDLKPSNILVTASGSPKLLDFGIAKILDPQRGEANLQQTVTLLRMLTPNYASPEQVRNQPISTSSDVYSLGVILYELLAEKLPYRVSTDAPQEMMKAVCETEPEKPSTAAMRVSAPEGSGSERTAAELAQHRSERERALKLSNVLAGDLDNIVLKALRKEPQRRYSSVEQFSEDIRRYLTGLPVLAHEDSLAYRTRKFVWRHRLGVAAVILLVLSLAGGLVATLWQAHIARSERARAERRFNDVRSLANSLIFDVHDSIKDLPGSTPARKLIVDRALQYLNSLAEESRGDFSLQRELATAYERVGLVQGHYLQSSLGDTKGSLDSYQKALRIREQIGAKSSDRNDRLALAVTHRLVAHQQGATGDRSGARENIDRAIAISEALNSAYANDPKILDELSFDYAVAAETADTQSPAGSQRMNDNFRRAVVIDEAILRIKPDDPESIYRYGVDLSHVGDMYGPTDRSVALSYYRKELEFTQKAHERSPDIRYARGVGRAYGHIAGIYDSAGDHQLALENDMRDLAIHQELFRVDPKNTLLQRGLAIEYGNVATRLSETGDAAGSVAYMQKGMEMMRALVTSSPQNTRDRGILGEFYLASGSNMMRAHKPEAALKDFGEGCAIIKSQVEAGHGRSQAGLAACVRLMGQAEAQSGNATQASDYYHQTLNIVEPMLADSGAQPEALYAAADAYSGLGDLKLLAAGQPGLNGENRRANWTEARSWYVKSRDAWRRIEHPSHVDPDGIEVGTLPEAVEQNIHRCDTALAKLPASQPAIAISAR
jgi:serine/threonine protein kinase